MQGWNCLGLEKVMISTMLDLHCFVQSIWPYLMLARQEKQRHGDMYLKKIKGNKFCNPQMYINGIRYPK